MCECNLLFKCLFKVFKVFFNVRWEICCWICLIVFCFLKWIVVFFEFFNCLEFLLVVFINFFFFFFICERLFIWILFVFIFVCFNCFWVWLSLLVVLLYCFFVFLIVFKMVCLWLFNKLFNESRLFIENFYELKIFF